MTDASTPFFSPVQRRIVGFAVGMLAFLAIIALFTAVVVVLGRLVGMFYHVIWPLAVAGILALMLRPLVGVFERRLRLSRVFAVMLLYALACVVLAGLLVLFVPIIGRQIVELVNTFPELWSRAVEAVRTHQGELYALYDRAMANETLRGLIEGGISQVQQFAMAALPNLKAAGGTVVGAFGFAANLAMVPVYLFFFLQSDESPTARLGSHLPFLKADTREDVVFLIREFIAIIVAFFRGQLLIGLIMGVLLAIGFTAAGLQFGVVFGLLAGLLNVIPYLGTIIGLSAVLPTAYFQTEGGLLTLGLCLGVFILVQLIEGYVLTPRIMGRQTGLHPVVIIIAIFFWGTALGGLLGMVLAIPLTAFFVTVWRLAKLKYFKEVG